MTVSVFTSILIFPKKTEAGIPVFDSANLGGKLTDISEKIARWVKEDLVKSLRDVIAKRIIDYIVDQTIVWIQGGGQPKFVTDWDGFLKDAANIAFDQVIKDVGLAQLCSPFKLQVQISLLPVQQFQQRIDCTLDDVVKNIEDFYNDFEKGGWIAYNETWQPQGNYYGEMLMIHDEMITRGALAKEAAEKEALAGKGFLSVKRCLEWDTEQTKCLKEEIVTPGDVVGAMASKAVGSDIDYILSAKELEQYVAAIVNAVINRVIKEGVGLIKGSSEYSYDTSSYTQPYEDALTDIQRQEKERMIAEYQMVIDDRNAVLANKNQSASSTTQLVVILKKIKATTCEPPVTDNEINSAESEVNRLRTEIADLQKLISEIQALKAEAENISPDYRLREMGLLTDKYNEFTNKYSSIILEVYSESAKRASQEELQRKQIELINAQARLTSCGLSL